MRRPCEALAARFGAACVDTVNWGTDVAKRRVARVAPDSVDQAAEVLRFAAAESLQVLPVGLGEHTPKLPPWTAVDLLLSMQRLDRVLEYEPEDLTLVAQAGARLADLEALLQPRRQRLPLTLPLEGTLGGAVAAGRFGLERLGEGTWRDVVLGARVLLADGTETRTGGKVVKNVTGYDLAKLYVGSRGTLVALVEINLRLATRPPARAMAIAQVDGREGETVLAAIWRSWLRPRALLMEREAGAAPDTFVVKVLFEGAPPAVAAQVEALGKIAGGVAWEATSEASLAVDAGQAPSSSAAWELCVGALPAEAARTLRSAVETCGDTVSGVAQYGVGVCRLRAPEPSGAALQRWADTQARAAGWHVSVETQPPGTPPWRPASTAFSGRMHAAIKRVFDPDGRFPALPAVAAAPMQTG